MFSKSIKSISQVTNQGLLATVAHYRALPLIVAAAAGPNQGYWRDQQTLYMQIASSSKFKGPRFPQSAAFQPCIYRLSIATTGVPSVWIGTVWWSINNPWTNSFPIFLHHQQLSSTNSSVAFLLNLNRPRDWRCCDSWDMRDEDGKCYFATLQMNEECYCQPEPA